MINAVTEQDLREVIKALVAEAKSGDLAAVRELLDRLLGKPIEIDLLDRLDELEQLARETQPRAVSKSAYPISNRAYAYVLLYVHVVATGSMVWE